MNRFRTGLVGLVIASVVSASAAGAQPAPPPAKPADSETVAQARQHFQRGVKLYEEDDFRTALIEFQRAYDLAPNTALLLNIGNSYFQLRDYANALSVLEKYLAESREIAKELRTQVEREVEDLRGRVAHVTVTSNVENAEISIDDVSIGKTPFPGPRLIGAGHHKLTASRAGYVTMSRPFDIAGNDKLSITVDLVPEASQADVVKNEKPNYTPAIIAGGIGVVGLTVGTVFGILALNNKSALDEACPEKSRCPPSAQTDIDGFDRNSAISTIGFGVGAAGIVAGAVLLFTAGGKKHEERPATARINHWLGLGQAGLSGSF